jgi:hypothetical protein
VEFSYETIFGRFLRSNFSLCNATSNNVCKFFMGFPHWEIKLYIMKLDVNRKVNVNIRRVSKNKLLAKRRNF